MKKEEALILVPQRSNLIIEYIERILSEDKKVNGNIRLSSYKIENRTMCTLDIIVPEINLEKHINLGITIDHSDLLYAQLFRDFLKSFLEHETIGVSRYYAIKYDMAENFTGIKAINLNGSEIKINFLCSGQKFDELTKEYNSALETYVTSYKQEDSKQIT